MPTAKASTQAGCTEEASTLARQGVRPAHCADTPESVPVPVITATVLSLPCCCGSRKGLTCMPTGMTCCSCPGCPGPCRCCCCCCSCRPVCAPAAAPAAAAPSAPLVGPAGSSPLAPGEGGGDSPALGPDSGATVALSAGTCNKGVPYGHNTPLCVNMRQTGAECPTCAGACAPAVHMGMAHSGHGGCAPTGLVPFRNPGCVHTAPKDWSGLGATHGS